MDAEKLIGRDPFNQHADRSDREKWTSSKGGPVFSKLFRLERTDPLSFGPKFPEILLNGSRPRSTFAGNSALFPSDDIDLAMCPFRDFVGKQFHLFDVM